MTNGHTRNKRTRGNARPRHTAAAPPPRTPGTLDNARNGIPGGPSAGPGNGHMKRAASRPTPPDGNLNNGAHANGADPHRRVRGAHPPRLHLGAPSDDEEDRETPMPMSSAPTMQPAAQWDLDDDDAVFPTPPPPHPSRPIAREQGWREQGWRAQPPRGIRPSGVGQRPPGPPSGPSSLLPEAAASAEGPASTMHETFVIGASRAPLPLVAPPGHAPFRPEVRGALGPMIDALKELFARDRMIASQGASVRCGICYLYRTLGDVEYREDDGFYVCPDCRQAMGSARLPMIRRQQR
jgi:hypothetical protein